MSDSRKLLVFGVMVFGALFVVRQLYGGEAVTNLFKFIACALVAIVVPCFVCAQLYEIFRDLNKGEELGCWSPLFGILTAFVVSYGVLFIQELIIGSREAIYAYSVRDANFALVWLFMAVQVVLGLIAWGVAGDSYERKDA